MDDQEQKEKQSLVLRILKSQYLCCLLAGICVWLIFVIAFLGGYHGFPLTIFSFPSALIPLLLAVIFTAIIVIRGIWSIIRVRNIVRSVVLILVTVGFWFTPRLIINQSTYLLGFKYRVLRISSPQELREIAARARELLTEQKWLPGPGRGIYEKEVHAKLWEQMQKYKVLELDHSSVIISIEDNNDVELTWGYALVSHWGIRIAQESVEPSKYDNSYIMIQEDIAVYLCPD